jgi:hypothetical protein
MIPENNKFELKENFFSTLANSWVGVLQFLFVWGLFSNALSFVFPFIALPYAVGIVFFVCLVVCVLIIATTLSNDYKQYVEDYEQDYVLLQQNSEKLQADNEILLANETAIKTYLSELETGNDNLIAKTERLEKENSELLSTKTEVQAEHEGEIANLKRLIAEKERFISAMQKENNDNKPKLEQWNKLKDYYFLVVCEIEPTTIMKWASFINTVNPKKQRIMQKAQELGVNLDFIFNKPTSTSTIKDATIIEEEK